MLISQLIPTLQVAIGPVVLISGIGLLILSMTNRFGRVIDRGRILARELAGVPEQDQVHIEAQLRSSRAGPSTCGGRSQPLRSASCWRPC